MNNKTITPYIYIRLKKDQYEFLALFYSALFYSSFRRNDIISDPD